VPSVISAGGVANLVHRQEAHTRPRTDVPAISSRYEPYRDPLGRHDRGQVGARGMLLAVRRPDGLAYLLADWGICAAFAAEYAAMVSVAPDRWRFVRTHPFDPLR
jgi:hypothetical protein